MIEKFKSGDKVVCTWGSDKGVEFIVVKVLQDQYSCKRVDKLNDRYYGFKDRHLRGYNK